MQDYEQHWDHVLNNVDVDISTHQDLEHCVAEHLPKGPVAVVIPQPGLLQQAPLDKLATQKVRGLAEDISDEEPAQFPPKGTP